MASCTGAGGGRFLSQCSASAPSMASTGLSLHFLTLPKHYSSRCLSMNGCKGDPTTPIGITETRTLPAAPTPGSAMDCLRSAVADFKADPPAFPSGIIRLQVPIHEKIEAIDWLHSQHHLLPRCFFSGRKPGSVPDLFLESDAIVNCNGNGSGNGRRNRNGGFYDRMEEHKLVSVAGVGSAVFFRDIHPFSYQDWLAIKRFLSKNCPLIRAYGGIRFDARSNVSPEWEAFGSFYFIVPQVEFDELEGSSMLATNIAWDNTLYWTWEEAITSLEATMKQVSSLIQKLKRQVPKAFILSNNHVPIKNYWDLSVKRALQMINGDDSALTKVVLARSSRFHTATNIDPITWLACLQSEGEDAYQFCFQPPNAPAFIGNTSNYFIGAILA